MGQAIPLHNIKIAHGRSCAIHGIYSGATKAPNRCGKLVIKIQQNNKLKMAQATLGCLQGTNHASLWAGIIGIEDAVASVESTVDAILARSVKQSARTGFTAQKRAAQTDLINAAFTVCSGLKALASATDDQQLFAQANFSRSALEKGRESEVVNRGQSLLTLGNEHAAALAAKYHVSANDLTALQDGLEDFAEVQPKPRLGRAASASATSELATLFSDLDKTLNEQLDPLMAKFRFTQPAFFAEYETARSIVDSAASHAAPANTTPLPAPLSKAA